MKSLLKIFSLALIAGIFLVSCSKDYTPVAPPTITSFTPATASSGATVTITGTNFTGATAVNFGSTAATSFTVNSETSITATVGNGASGNVSVTTPGGTATKAGFTFALNITATLNAASEVPPTSSSATANFAGTYNPSTRVLAGTLIYTGLTPIAWHIHKGAFGVAGAVVFDLGGIVPVLSINQTLSLAQEADLLANNYYINIHTAANPAGEIRGQLIQPSITSSFAATLTGAAETPPVSTAATGSMTASYNSTTKVLSGTLSYTGLIPTAWHIHRGAAGVAGSVIFDLGAIIPTPKTFSVTLSASEEADLMANLYYVNIHTAANAAGEIRGQIIKQ